MTPANKPLPAAARIPFEPRRGACTMCRIVNRLLLVLLVLLTCQPWLARAETPLSIDMKLLIVSADGSEPVYAAIKATLDQLGVPYDTLIASQRALTKEGLSDGLGNGHYQGVLLTTGNLSYLTPTGTWASAFTIDEWNLLWQYEADFRVRQVTLYTYPAGAPDNYGLNVVAAQSTDTTALQTQLTTNGQQVFGYLNAKNPIAIRNAWTYLATPASTTNPIPLLTTSNGYAIASIYTYPNGRQNLTITADGNPELTHTLLLGYGVVNWVSKGLFLGQRAVYLNAQPDDVMIPDDLWDVRSLTDTTGLEYRITGSDYKKLFAWQNNLRASNPMYAQIRLELPFNGVGVSGIYPNDTLTSAIKGNPNQFKWVNHTYDHEVLTTITYSAATTELKNNHQVAQKIGFNQYFKDSMIQPEISGLNNPEFLRAAKDFGIRYILSDTSQPGWANPSPNTGFYSSYQPTILIIPRYPTNLYYNVSTPAEWVSEYNHFYAPGGLFPTWDHELTYAEVLDKESDIWLRYFLKYSVDSVMFHQSNLRFYDATHSLLSDLINAALVKYSSMMTLPILSPSQHDTGRLMAARMAYNSSGVTARLQLGTSNTIVLIAATAVQVPLTGINYGSGIQTYGGQTISSVPLVANLPLTIPAPAW